MVVWILWVFVGCGMGGRFVVVVVWVVGFWWVVGFVGGEFMDVVGNV